MTNTTNTTSTTGRKLYYVSHYTVAVGAPDKLVAVYTVTATNPARAADQVRKARPVPHTTDYLSVSRTNATGATAVSLAAGGAA